jgi:hypothetical protein
MTDGSALTTYIMNNGLIVGIALIAFLVFNEVFSTNINKNKKIKLFINITIVPLFLIFFIIVIFNAFSILSNS